MKRPAYFSPSITRDPEMPMFARYPETMTQYYSFRNGRPRPADAPGQKAILLGAVKKSSLVELGRHVAGF